MTEILSEEAVAFVADLNRRFRPRRNELLAARAERRAANSRFDDARKLFERVALADDFADFLTTAAYDSID